MNSRLELPGIRSMTPRRRGGSRGCDERLGTPAGDIWTKWTLRPKPCSAAAPLSASVSLRDRAYAALKQMITEADIYAHPEEIRLTNVS